MPEIKIPTKLPMHVKILQLVGGSLLIIFLVMVISIFLSEFTLFINLVLIILLISCALASILIFYFFKYRYHTYKHFIIGIVLTILIVVYFVGIFFITLVADPPDC